MRYPGVGWSISSQCKDPVTVIKFMDFFFTEEGSDLMNWGIEGETYVVNADGTKSYTDTVMKSEQTPLGYLRSLGIQYRIGMNQNPEYEYAFMTPAAKAAAELYNSHPEWFAKDVPYLDGKLGLNIYLRGEYRLAYVLVDEKFQIGTADFDANRCFIAEQSKRY